MCGILLQHTLNDTEMTCHIKRIPFRVQTMLFTQQLQYLEVLVTHVTVDYDNLELAPYPIWYVVLALFFLFMYCLGEREFAESYPGYRTRRSVMNMM